MSRVGISSSCQAEAASCIHTLAYYTWHLPFRSGCFCLWSLGILPRAGQIQDNWLHQNRDTLETRAALAHLLEGPECPAAQRVPGEARTGNRKVLWCLTVKQIVFRAVCPASAEESKSTATAFLTAQDLLRMGEVLSELIDMATSFQQNARRPSRHSSCGHGTERQSHFFLTQQETERMSNAITLPHSGSHHSIQRTRSLMDYVVLFCREPRLFYVGGLPGRGGPWRYNRLLGSWE